MKNEGTELPTETLLSPRPALQAGASIRNAPPALRFLTVHPALSPQALIAARIKELENKIKSHQRIVESRQEEINRIRALPERDEESL